MLVVDDRLCGTLKANCWKGSSTRNGQLLSTKDSSVDGEKGFNIVSTLESIGMSHFVKADTTTESVGSITFRSKEVSKFEGLEKFSIV